MNPLWITNILLPDAARALGLAVPWAGGWMQSLARAIASQPGIRLSVAAIHAIEQPTRLDAGNVTYFVIPTRYLHTSLKSVLATHWRDICEQVQPDVVHIHGTEYPHGLSCMLANPERRYIVSVQGIIGVYARYMMAGLSSWDVMTTATLRDVLRADTIFQRMHRWTRRGVQERKYFERADVIVGRTSWDRAHVQAINPRARYRHCDETLRDAFYESSHWDYHAVNTYSIFVSQGDSPIKGIHQVIKALSLLTDEFPSIHVRVAGTNIVSSGTLRRRLARTGYATVVRRLLREHGLTNHVTFLGPLDAAGMAQEYRRAHVYVCPSSIENSPNSLGEAQLIGTPAIASFVGGIPDMIEHGRSGLVYRFEEVEMLAQHIRDVFANEDLARYLSVNGRAAAVQRHDPNINVRNMLDIYASVVSR